MPIIRIAALTLLAIALAGCGGEEATGTVATSTAPATVDETTTAPDAPTTTEEATTAETESETGGYTGLEANTYEVARQLCEHDGLRKLARELGVSRQARAVAHAYAELVSEEGSHREASFDGCLTGLRGR